MIGHSDRFEYIIGRVKRVLPSLFILLLLIGGAGCRSAKKGGSRGDRPRVEGVVPVEGASDVRMALAREAESWVGVPYRYGGHTKDGTDCSGMVLTIYLDVAGIKLPRNSAAQAEFCSELSEKELKVGDLVFFATGKDPGRVSHVGILIGEGRFVHSSSSKGVMVSDLSTPYYQRTFLRFGRVPSLK